MRYSSHSMPVLIGIAPKVRRRVALHYVRTTTPGCLHIGAGTPHPPGTIVGAPELHRPGDGPAGLIEATSQPAALAAPGRTIGRTQTAETLWLGRKTSASSARDEPASGRHHCHRETPSHAQRRPRLRACRLRGWGHRVGMDRRFSWDHTCPSRWLRRAGSRKSSAGQSPCRCRLYCNERQERPTP